MSEMIEKDNVNEFLKLIGFFYDGKPIEPIIDDCKLPYEESYKCPDFVNYDLKPKWDECPIGGSFSMCEHFKNKEKCWERFDKENSK